MSKPIRKRSEVAAEFTWDLTDIFPSDEAWRAEYEALKPYTEAGAASVRARRRCWPISDSTMS